MKLYLLFFVVVVGVVVDALCCRCFSDCCYIYNLLSFESLLTVIVAVVLVVVVNLWLL